jgi:DNA end-binding protein Ku
MPIDDSSAEAYAVIQQAMRHANSIALGRLVMHTRERLVAIEPRETGLIGTTLRTRDEVVNMAEALSTLPSGRGDKQMVDIARKIIDQKYGEFDPDQFTDRYEDALRALIEEKKRGHKITRVAEPEDVGNVVDLMEALRRSLGQKSQPTKARNSSNVTKLPRKKNR